MNILELRDLDEAREFVLQGLWLQRTVVPHGHTVRDVLAWSLEIVANGQPLPPVGMVADFGRVALSLDRDTRSQRDALTIPNWSRELAPRYEDYVLGKIYADWTFERAGDALRRYAGPTREQDRRRGLAYLIKQFRERAGFTAVEMAPGVLRGMLDENPDQLLIQGWELIKDDGPDTLLLRMYRECIDACRRMAELLAVEDVIALEQRTALADMGQYVAHRQVLQVASRLEEFLPLQKVRPLQGRREVPTRVLDEDTYPVGGFTSISNRGSIESLLHSQLAYMEPVGSFDGPDLFDIKFLRDELYYYSRDENQFLRRRRAFVFALWPDLARARFKDPELPCQRIVLLLGLLLTITRKLIDWLSEDALHIEFLIVSEGVTKPLAHEVELLTMLLAEQIENGTVSIQPVGNTAALRARCEELARRAMCHCLTMNVEPMELSVDHAVVTQIVIDGPEPKVGTDDETPASLEADDPMEAWGKTVLHLLQLWV